MKKFVLTCLSLIIAGQFCFASNLQDFKKEMSNNKEIFSELKNSLNESYQESKVVEEIVGIDAINQTQEDPSSMLTNKYPEFLNTTMENLLKEAFKANPKLEIKSVSYTIPDFDLTSSSSNSVFTAITSTGKKISVSAPYNEYYDEIADLWTNNPQKLAQYREVLRIHILNIKNIRTLIKQQSGADYNETIPFRCTQRVYKVNATGDKRLECMPVSVSKTKNTYTQMGAVRYYKIGTNSSWMYGVGGVEYFKIGANSIMYGVDNKLWIANMSKTNKNSFNPYMGKPQDASICVSKGYLVYRGFIPSLPFTETGNNSFFDTNILPNGGLISNSQTDYKCINLQNDEAFWDGVTKMKAIDNIGLYEDAEGDWHWSGSHWVRTLNARGELFFLENNKLLPFISKVPSKDEKLGYYCRSVLFTPYDRDWAEAPETHLMNYVAKLSNNQSCDQVVKTFSSVLKNHMNLIK